MRLTCFPFCEIKTQVSVILRGPHASFASNWSLQLTTRRPLEIFLFSLVTVLLLYTSKSYINSSILVQHGSNWTEKWFEEDKKSSVLYRSMLATYIVCNLYSVFILLLISCTHTHIRPHELSAQSLPVFSEWCLCVVQACSWAVYIHGESHLGSSQPVCLWLLLPVVTSSVQCWC